jgi:hypothetical protein
MSVRERLIYFGGLIPRTVYSLLPFEGISRPVFIIGCGRSGTSIFGTALSKHRHVTYLNEPRHLWFSAYPETDIWTHNAYSHNGKLILTATDVEDKKSNKLSRLFRFETIKSRKPVLIEKLPINSFRLHFVHQIFPDARFIHIYRNGLEVARSIEKFCERDDWFGENYYKWEKLVEYALGRDNTYNLPALCSTCFDKGLLEWRLSTEAAVDFSRNLPDDAFFELSYDDLVQSPVATISQVLNFIGIDNDLGVLEFAAENLSRKTSTLEQGELSEKDKILGGKLLSLSMDGKKGLVTRC